MYVQINFGRGINLQGFTGVEMGQQNWDQMTMLIEAHLERFARKVTFDELYEATVESHDGIGKWDGKSETSRHLSACIEGSSRQDNHMIDCIRELQSALDSIRRDNYQDCIALIVAGTYTNHDGVYYAN